MTPQALAEKVLDARERTLALVRALDDEQLLGPRLAIVNPPLWELGHVGWFQEYWVLRHAASRAPLRPEGDALYDSARVHHDTRWDLSLPSCEDTLAYLAAVHDRVLDVARQAGERGDRGTTATRRRFGSLTFEYPLTGVDRSRRRTPGRWSPAHPI